MMKLNRCFPSKAIDHLAEKPQVALSEKILEMPQLMNFQNYYSEKSPVSTSRTVSIRAMVLEYHQFLDEHPLTKRELEILQLIVKGNTNSEIAEELHLTIGTVKTHLRNIFNKLDVNDRTQAAVIALRAGLVD